WLIYPNSGQEADFPRSPHAALFTARQCLINARGDRMKSRKIIYSVLAVLMISCAVLAFGQQGSSKRGVTPEDYFSFKFLSDPHISPDGKLVAYVLTAVDRRQNRRHSSIWMAAMDGSRPPWQFTNSPQSSNSPRWSLDGQVLAFQSSRPPGPANNRA